MTVALYTGLCEKRWNGVPVQPGRYACISPVNGRSTRTKRKTSVDVPADVQIIQDSSAFSDSWSGRLDFAAALDRQLQHSDQYAYTDQITHRASYDMLIDEWWQDGKRSKRRWSVSEAESAVETTVKAAAYMAACYDGPRVLSVQGVDADQYMRCAERLIGYLQPGDILGMGGWCILGMRREWLPVFDETISRLIPFASRHGVQRLHIWGVIFPTALGRLLWLADHHDIIVSTDSTSPTLLPTWGQWGYAEWRTRITSRQNMGQLRVKHVRETINYLQRLRSTPHYMAPPVSPRQLSLFDFGVTA